MPQLLPQIQAATSKGVDVFLITKAHSERTRQGLATIRQIEKQLSNIGVIVMHKLRMHEKLIFIDEDIT